MSRLRFDLKTRLPVVERPDKEICGICKRQTSRYTCPSCNLPYCSLNCFKSEKHSECSETFYRKEIESDIQSAPVKSVEERGKMMELLRKFEEENAQDADDNVFQDDGEDLAEKLEGINLDDADPNALWKALSPAQRDSFLKAMRDPSSDLAQELLASSELTLHHRKPWWESPELSLSDSSEITNKFGALPGMLSIPVGLRTAEKNSGSNSLAYNILALCLAYAYVTRRLSISPLSSLEAKDPDRLVAQDLVSRLVPFLADRKSKLVFENVDSLVTDIWSRLEALSDPPSRTSFALFLADAARLIRPSRVAIIDEGELQSHHSRVALLAISDLIELFSSSSNRRHVVLKLNFYAAHLCSQDSNFLHIIADEVRVAGLEMQTPPST